ncbi:MAG: serine/threonine-protein kinase [Planctomycetota bacterium]
MAGRDELREQLQSPEFVAALLPDEIKIREKLAEGGQAVVHRGTVGSIDAAVKVYLPGQELERRVEREINALSNIDCPSLVKLLWSGEVLVSNQLRLSVVATEYVDGEVLEQRISRRPLSGDEMGVVAFDVAQAVKAMWAKRIVHRDLKPANILIRANGRACVIDLGVARHLEQSSLTALNSTWGTRGYMSPEQARCIRQLSCKSDLYSLGVILLEAGTGFHPTTRDQFALMNMVFQRPLPDPVEQWKHAALIVQLLQQSPVKRPLPQAVLDLLSTHALRDGGQ